MAETTARLNLRPLNYLLGELRRKASGGHIDDMLKQWGVRYLRDMRRRYLRLSRGGGEWPALTEEYSRRKLRRRKPRPGYKGKRRTGIMIDTGSLLGALNPTFQGQGGQLFQRTRNGVRVGYSDAPHAGGVTYAKLVKWHANAKKKRAIIVEPQATTIRGMSSDARRALQSLSARAERKGT